MIKSNKNIFFIFSILILLFLFVLYLLIGPVKISPTQIIDILFKKLGLINQDYSSYSKIQETVILNLRLPRLFMAVLVGSGLGATGAVLQGLFRNPLIDPGFIGVSSGAAVGAIIAIMFSQISIYFFSVNFSYFLIPLLSVLGSFVTTYSIYKISKYYNKTNIMTMLLAGIAINALSGSIIGLFISFSSDLELRTFTFWTLGGLDSADWQIMPIVLLFIVSSLIVLYLLKNKLDIFMLGDEQAAHLGIDVEKLKKTIILFSAIIVGVSVAFCGMIGFVGLVTPHIIRLFVGPKHKYLIPGSALFGAFILVISDLIAKTIISPAQLPIGVITSLIGAPFFIFLILKQKNRIGYAE
tara:strand:- start:96 stop:1157 length:1062 start_codon:yes stop_codon:yes gene_type:complete